MSRRLVNRGRSSGANGSAAPAPSGLPEYEPLECPLDDEGRRALEELSTNRMQNRYVRNLKAGATNLSNSVGDIQEQLFRRRAHLATQKRRRGGEDDEDPEAGAEDLEALEEYLDEYAGKVDQNSREAEAALRLLIDRRAELEEEGNVIADLYLAATNAQADENTRQLAKERRREVAIEIAQTRGEPIPPEEDDDDDEDKPPPPASNLHGYRKGQDGKRHEYEQLTFHQRYALHNEYAGFKKVWNDAAVGEDGPPLPDASRWFSASDEPILPTVALRAGGRSRSRTADPGNDSDDDIAVAREVTSLRCPLSLQEFVEPYSNNKCKHTFEKSAILDYLPASGEVQCPQTGCSQVFTRDDFAQDFYLDHALLRRIQRRKAFNELDDIDMEEEANMSTDFQISSQQTVGRRAKAEA